MGGSRWPGGSALSRKTAGAARDPQASNWSGGDWSNTKSGMGSASVDRSPESVPGGQVTQCSPDVTGCPHSISPFHIWALSPGGALQAHPTGATDDACTPPLTCPSPPALAPLAFSGRMAAPLTRPGTRPRGGPGAPWGECHQEVAGWPETHAPQQKADAVNPHGQPRETDPSPLT